MPSGFKRFGEKFKQALNINPNSKDWKPTSNARNLAMIEETRAFAMHLKLLQKDLGLLEERVESTLRTMRTVLSARLPRAFDEINTGVSPVDPEDHYVGVAVNQEAISSASLEMKQRLTDEVIFPLQQWLAAYRSIKVSNKKVEETRLDLDTKRRDTAAMQEKHAKLQAANHKDADAVLYKAQSEEDKMNRLAARYHEMEAEVFNALLTLISDTAVLRDYQAAALAIVQRCFTMAYTAFDLSATVPMPQLPSYSQQQQPQPQPPTGPPVQLSGGNRSSQGGQSGLRSSNSNSMGNMTRNSQNGIQAPPSYEQQHQCQQGVIPTAPQPGSQAPQGAGYPQMAGIAPMVAAPAPPYSPQPTANDRPEAPSWFNEAKKNANQPNAGSDSEDGSVVMKP